MQDIFQNSFTLFTLKMVEEYCWNIFKINKYFGCGIYKKDIEIYNLCE